jgi:RNA polymerase primary sigma factor
MSEILGKIETVEYIENNNLFSKIDEEDLSPIEIAELFVEGKKQERERRYKNDSTKLNENLFYNLLRYKLLYFDPKSSKDENNYRNDRKKNSKTYKDCFSWDREKLENTQLGDDINKTNVIKFLDPDEDITYEKAEELLIANPNTLVVAMTLLTNNYKCATEKVVDTSRKRQFGLEAHEITDPFFRFTDKEELLFLTGRTMLVALNRTYESKYVQELLKDIDGIIWQFNQGLIASIALKYIKGAPLDDLKQQGTIGLLRALKTFEIDRGNKFSTYATYWIRQKISRYVADNANIIRHPVHLRDSLNRFLKAKRELEIRKKEEVSIKETIEYCKKIGVDIPDNEKTLRNAILQRQTVYLDEHIGDKEGDDALTLMNLVPENINDLEDEVFESFEKKMIDDIFKIANLKFRESLIVRMRWGILPNEENLKRDNFTLEEISQRMGVTRERIRQIEKVAMRKLRRALYMNKKLSNPFSTS